MEKIKEIYSNNLKSLTSKTKEIFDIVEGKGKVPAKLVIVLGNPDENMEVDGLKISESLDATCKKALERADLDKDASYFTYAVKVCPYDISRRGKIKYRQVNNNDIELFSGFLSDELEYVAEGLVLAIGDIAKKTVLLPFDNTEEELRLNNASKIISFKTEDDFIKNIDLVVDKLLEMKEDDLLSEGIKAKKAKSKTVISSVKQVDREEIYENNSLDDYEVEAWNDFNKAISSKSANKDVVLLYAGSNLENDACKSIIESVASVFNDLNMNVIMLNVYDRDFSADLFLDSLQSSAGFVLGSSVDWYGTGHKLQSFLDDLYYSGRSDLLRGMPAMLITISRGAYEEEGMNFVKNSLEILGATVSDTLTGAIENSVYYDTNKSYQNIVETKTEDFYRHIKKGASRLPSSMNSRKVYIKVNREKANSGQESENVQKPKAKKNINTYNEFLETQKRDIDELSEIFMEKMNVSSKGKSYKDVFISSFIKGSNFDKSNICFDIEDNKSENFNIIIDKNSIKALAFNNVDCDVIISLSQKNMDNIINKKVTMQKSFLTGEVKVKGNFALLYKMDGMFEF